MVAVMSLLQVVVVVVGLHTLQAEHYLASIQSLLGVVEAVLLAAMELPVAIVVSRFQPTPLAT